MTKSNSFKNKPIRAALLMYLGAQLLLSACAPSSKGIKVQVTPAKIVDSTEAQSEQIITGQKNNLGQEFVYLMPTTSPETLKSYLTAVMTEAQKKGAADLNQKIRLPNFMSDRNQKVFNFKLVDIKNKNNPDKQEEAKDINIVLKTIDNKFVGSEAGFDFSLLCVDEKCQTAIGELSEKNDEVTNSITYYITQFDAKVAIVESNIDPSTTVEMPNGARKHLLADYLESADQVVMANTVDILTGESRLWISMENSTNLNKKIDISGSLLKVSDNTKSKSFKFENKDIVLRSLRLESHTKDAKLTFLATLSGSVDKSRNEGAGKPTDVIRTIKFSVEPVSTTNE